jgi:hypothetical protein
LVRERGEKHSTSSPTAEKDIKSVKTSKGGKKNKHQEKERERKTSIGATLARNTQTTKKRNDTKKDDKIIRLFSFSTTAKNSSEGRRYTQITREKEKSRDSLITDRFSAASATLESQELSLELKLNDRTT